MRRALTVAAIAGSVLTLAACGGSGSGGARSGPSSTTATPRLPFGGTQQPPQLNASAFARFRDCLQKHGVSIPTGPPGGAGPSGLPRPDAKTQAAMQACLHFLPARPQETPNA